jgi:hypothetical protein
MANVCGSIFLIGSEGKPKVKFEAGQLLWTFDQALL